MTCRKIEAQDNLVLRRFICASTLSLKHVVVRQQEIQDTAMGVYEFSQSMAYFTVHCSWDRINYAVLAANLTLLTSLLMNNLKLL